MENTIYNVLILGAGISGLTCSIFCGRANLSHLVFTNKKCEIASMISNSNIIENFPGHITIEGKELVRKIKKQAVKHGAIIVEKCIVKVDFSVKPFLVYVNDGTVYKGSSIVVATGSVPNRLNIENEDKLWGKYISSCVLCDASHFKNKRLVICGGSEAGLEGAIMLTKFSNKVTLIHRRNTFRASVVIQQKVLKNSKIKVITDNEITKLNIDANDKLVSITCKNSKTEEETEIKADALFYGLGFLPNSELFKGILDLDANGHVKIYSSDHFYHATNIPGVFACGDVTNSSIAKLAIIASGQGCKCALDCNAYLHDMHIVENEEF
jgi:thioredoxin reductase (NADPH)